MIVHSDARSLEARSGFLKALSRHGRIIEREAPSAVWEVHSDWGALSSQMKARLRRFDLVVGSTREGWRSMRLIGRGGCSPVLAVSMPEGFGGGTASEPSLEASRMMHVARSLSAIDVSLVDDEADGLARAASMILQPTEVSVEVTRPTPWSPASIRMISMRSGGSFTLMPGKRDEERHRPIRERLDRMLAIASPRLADAVSCTWGADGGGGHSLIVRPSTAGGIWRSSEHNAVDNLRLSADWVREIEGSMEP